MAVEELPPSYSVGSIIYSTEPLKRALVTETKAWKQAFGKALANKASADMEEIFTFFDNMCKRLSRPIKDLDDVRNTMAALREVRESEIKYVFSYYLCSLIVYGVLVKISRTNVASVGRAVKSVQNHTFLKYYMKRCKLTF